MQLSSNHIFYTAASDMAEITNPLRQLGITYFTYSRNYRDGSRLTLQNGSHVLDIYYKKKHYLTGNSECKPEVYKEQTVLWSTLPNQKVIDECARSCGFDHGIFMFQPQIDHCEIFAFATDSKNDRIINTYLSKMDVLTRFKEYFREKAAPLIKQAVKQSFILPFNDRPDINNAFINADISNELLLSSLHVKNFLTPRQIECCALLLQGKTAKEIGLLLNLSTRTVEYYLGNIKTKLQCDNRANLITKLIRILKNN